MLWRRFNEVEDLIEIVKLMEFTNSTRIGTYNHPFYNKKFPIKAPLEQLEELIISESFIAQDGEGKTYQISRWVSNNIVYHRTKGESAQFKAAKDAYYYFKRVADYNV
tara:strand:+ start:685 stop:1008 length:324 start_codon:yes stop_codon:yes gene_type:complete